MTAQRNVLFLIADDWSRIADCYGNSVVHTPRIDAFAREGTVFEQAFCTSPSCAVSRACILTGYHSHTHGQYGHCHGIHGFSTHPPHYLHTFQPEGARLRHGLHRQKARRTAQRVPL